MSHLRHKGRVWPSLLAVAMFPVIFALIYLWRSITSELEKPVEVDALANYFLGVDMAPASLAKYIVHDRSMGGEFVEVAIDSGDVIIPFLRNESNNFSKLDNRNSFWVAEVLSGINTDTSISVLLELANRENITQKLVGFLGMAILDVSQLHWTDWVARYLQEAVSEWQVILGASGTTLSIESSRPSHEAELAIRYMKFAGDHTHLPLLRTILRTTPMPYQIHKESCNAVAAIGGDHAVAHLMECLEDESFYAITPALEGLVSLGCMAAIPIAARRIPNAGNEKRRLVKALNAIAGIEIGEDVEAWLEWYARFSNEKK